MTQLLIMLFLVAVLDARGADVQKGRFIRLSQAILTIFFPLLLLHSLVKNDISISICGSNMGVD